MADAIERSIVRFHPESQGEFAAIMNAIATQLKSSRRRPSPKWCGFSVNRIAPNPGRRASRRAAGSDLISGSTN
jgi:hypothetical protein